MKILVVRFSSIGDIVLITPVLRCLKQQIPNAELHVLTKFNFATLFENQPYIDVLHTIKKDIDEVKTALKQEKFDCIIDLHNNLRTRRLSLYLGIKTHRFPKLNIRKWLLTNFKLNTMPSVHVVDRYFEAVKSLGVVSDGKPCDLFLSDEEVKEGNELCPKEGFIAVALGAQFATKQVPVQLLAESLKSLKLPIVLLGGEGDMMRSNELKAMLKDKELLDYCGKLSLRMSTAVLAQANVLLTGDTGLMHLASCFEVPIVSVWGNTVPELGMYAYEPRKDKKAILIQRNDVSCRPCSKIGYKECPKGHFECMNHNAKAIEEGLMEFISH